MGEIYQSAQAVVIFLGAEDEHTSIFGNFLVRIDNEPGNYDVWIAKVAMGICSLWKHSYLFYSALGGQELGFGRNIALRKANLFSCAATDQRLLPA